MKSDGVQRQHLAAVYIDGCWNFVSFFFYIIIYRFVSGAGVSLDTVDLGLISYVLVLGTISLIFSFLSWWCFTYVVDENGGLKVRTGLLFRKNREIRRERVQVVDIEAGPLQQLCGVVSLKIETAGGQGEAEVVFKALKKKVAEALKSNLDGAEDSVETSAISLSEHDSNVHVSEQSNSVEQSSLSTSAKAGRKLYSISNWDLFLYAASSGRLGYVFVAGYFIVNQMPPERVMQIERFLSDSVLTLDGFVLVLFLILAFCLAWFVSVIAEMVSYSGFAIEQRKDGLSVSYGLFKKRSFDIPSNKIRALVLKENIVRRLLGQAAIYVEVNCGKEKSNKEVLLLCPIISRGNIEEFCRSCVPSIPEIPSSFESPPLRSIHRYVLRHLVIGGLFFSLFWVFTNGETFGSIQIMAASAWLALCAYFGFLDWRYSGIAFAVDGVSVRNFGFSLKTTVIKRRAVLGVSLRAHPLMRFSRVTTIAMAVASGEGARRLRFASYDSGERAFRWYHGNLSA